MEREINIYNMQGELIDCISGDLMDTLEKLKDGNYKISSVAVISPGLVNITIEQNSLVKIKIQDGRTEEIRTVRFVKKEDADEYLESYFSKRNGDTILEYRIY